MKAILIRILRWAGIIAGGIFSFLIASILFGAHPVYAYPEYATRTNEPCAACHVNPGGGGPRTLVGLLWSAQGRPDQVPDLGGVLIAPGVEDGVELYDIACSSCHGVSAEGLFGIALVSSGIAESKIESTILRGRERSGMPAFDGQFTDDQLATIVAYVTGIASGEMEPAPLSYPLKPGALVCEDSQSSSRCGGN